MFIKGSDSSGYSISINFPTGIDNDENGLEGDDENLSSSCVELADGYILLADRHLSIISISRAWRNSEQGAAAMRTGCDAVGLIARHGTVNPDLLRSGLSSLINGEQRDWSLDFRSRSLDPLMMECRATIVRAAEPMLLIQLFEEPEARRRGQETALLMAQEAERRRIACELHDDLMQHLVAVKFGVELLRAETGSDRGARCCDTMEAALVAAQHQVRTLSFVLHPPGLQPGGLPAAIAQLTRGFERRSHIPTHFEADVTSSGVHPGAEIAIYRVAQEAMSNILRHAQASRIDVRLICDDDGLTLAVRDDGQGIGDPEDPGSDPACLGVGLRSMRERLAAFSGTLSIERCNPGTMVLAHIARTLPASGNA